MIRKLLFIAPGDKVEDHLDMANQLGVQEVVVGIPPAYIGLVSPLVQFPHYLEIGEPEPEEPSIEDIQSQKKDEISTECATEIYNGFMSITTAHEYEFSQQDQDNIVQKMLELVIDPTITEVSWKTKDAGEVTHSRDEFFAVYKESQEFKSERIDKRNRLIAISQSLTDKDKVKGIDWKTTPVPVQPIKSAKDNGSGVDNKPSNTPSEV